LLDPEVPDMFLNAANLVRTISTPQNLSICCSLDQFFEAFATAWHIGITSPHVSSADGCSSIQI
jgi:hypothetical protein